MFDVFLLDAVRGLFCFPILYIILRNREDTDHYDWVRNFELNAFSYVHSCRYLCQL